MLQLVSPHTLSLSVVRITALSSSAVLKSIFNSVLTRVPFYSVSHVHIEHIETEKGSLYIDTFFINPSSFNSFTAECVAWAAHTKNTLSNECSISNLMRPDCYCRQIFTMKLEKNDQRKNMLSWNVILNSENYVYFSRFKMLSFSASPCIQLITFRTGSTMTLIIWFLPGDKHTLTVTSYELYDFIVIFPWRIHWLIHRPDASIIR